MCGGFLPNLDQDLILCRATRKILTTNRKQFILIALAKPNIFKNTPIPRVRIFWHSDGIQHI